MARVPLTPRERAVLAAVARRLTNSEIASELFISVRTVESHIASLRRKLAVGSRRELIEAAARLRDANVPIPANPLRGRGRDQARIRELLHTHRCVSIVGVGGVGKTRLALEIARSHPGHVPLVVELEHAGPTDVITLIARSLRLEAAADATQVASIAVALGTHPYLVVLDNADRVGAATAEAIRRLRQSGAGAPILVTSRTPLGAVDEAVYPLAPLSTDGVDSPASALLADRLAAAGHRLDAAEQTVAERICARLDGLPLALELAASVARHLPLSELDERLARDFAALDRAAPSGRHRTLETAFAWTWDLLTPEEQDCLRRLAALPRTFDLELAAVVTARGAAGVVLRLLDHSLIVPTGGVPLRFRLLAVMREFVHARTDPELIRDVLRRHAEYVCDIAVDFASRARTDSSPEAARTRVVMCAEANAALRWALAARHPTALPLATALSVGVHQYGLDAGSARTLAEAARDEWLLERAAAQDLQVIGDALAYLDVDLVTALGDRALGIAADSDSRRAAHQLAGFAAAYRQQTEVALRHLAEAERLAKQLGQDWELGAIRQARGIALSAGPAPDPDAALEAYSASIRAYARAGDRTYVNNVRYMMASTAADSPVHREQAIAWAAEARAEAERMCNEHEAAHARLVQATLGLAESGELDELVGSFSRIGDQRCLNRALLLRAEAAATPAERIAVLARALEIADAVSDHGRQTATVERLVRAYHDAGDQPAVLAALDRLSRLAGRRAAESMCPPELLPAFSSEEAGLVR